LLLLSRFFGQACLLLAKGLFAFVLTTLLFRFSLPLCLTTHRHPTFLFYGEVATILLFSLATLPFSLFYFTSALFSLRYVSALAILLLPIPSLLLLRVSFASQPLLLIPPATLGLSLALQFLSSGTFLRQSSFSRSTILFLSRPTDFFLTRLARLTFSLFLHQAHVLRAAAFLLVGLGGGALRLRSALAIMPALLLLREAEPHAAGLLRLPARRGDDPRAGGQCRRAAQDGSVTRESAAAALHGTRICPPEPTIRRRRPVVFQRRWVAGEGRLGGSDGLRLLQRRRAGPHN
jgi:hypothetical protein